jgi:LPS export ABC transporter protein LptC
MKPWQSYARVGVALVGLASAGLVYKTLGSRRVPAAAAPVNRVDPEAALETTGGEFQRVRNGEQEFDVTAAQSLFYKDGSVKQRDVSITARNRGGRDFVITASEARSERDEQALQLTGNIKLKASDGFELTTDTGSFDRSTGIAQSPGEVAFAKDRLTGSGVGMTYEQATDVLRVLERAAVELANADGSVNLSFTATHATLDRLQHVLHLEGDVRVHRGGETMSGERGVAMLSDELDSVHRIELRGDARVEGGSTEVATMSARDIDLDYSEDGKTGEDRRLDRNRAVGDQARCELGGWWCGRQPHRRQPHRSSARSHGIARSDSRHGGRVARATRGGGLDGPGDQSDHARGERPAGCRSHRRAFRGQRPLRGRRRGGAEWGWEGSDVR